MTPTLPPRPRSPWQRLYRAAHRWRHRWWHSRAESLSTPVVSVGALHWGGVGKTPLTIAIASRLREQGRRVIVLSRGYGRSSRGPCIVGRGDGPILSPQEAGDEPYLMATELPGVPVVVGARRAEAARLASEGLEPPPELFVLDDAFSHLRLERDLDLVVLPQTDPYGGGRLPPAGRLREPLESLRRADAVILTGLTADPAAARRIAEALRERGLRGPGFACPHEVGPLRLLGAEGEAGDPRAPVAAAAPCLLVTGVARPDRVRRAAERLGLDVRHHLALPDHHRYPDRTLDQIDRLCESHRADLVVTTAKDAAKLRQRLPRFGRDLAVLRVTAAPEPAFWEWLDQRLEEVST